MPSARQSLNAEIACPSQVWCSYSYNSYEHSFTFWEENQFLVSHGNIASGECTLWGILRTAWDMQTSRVGFGGFTVFTEDWSFDDSNINCPNFSKRRSWIKEDNIFNPSSQPKVVTAPCLCLENKKQCCFVNANKLHLWDWSSCIRCGSLHKKPSGYERRIRCLHLN